MSDPVAAIALFFLGLYAGSLLTEGAVLVPIWRRLPAEDFFRMHKDVGPRLYRYYAPITIAGVMAPVAFMGLALATGHAPHPLALAAVALCLCALATYFVYFQRANARFAGRSLSDAELGPELARWAQVHWARTVFIVTAFALLLISQI